MIKKFLLGLGFSIFCLLGFTNADGSSFQVVGLSSKQSFLDQQYDITFLKGGGLLTSFLGYSREILALKDNVLFWWTNDGMPYIYAGNFNGYYNKVFSCDSMLSGNDYAYPENCSPFDINLGNGPDIFKSFFSNVDQNDIVYYSYTDSGRPYWWNTFDLCFNSSGLNKSLCFKSCANYNGGGVDCQFNLSGSLDFGDLDVKFSTVPYGYVGKAPGQFGYGNDNYNPGEIEDITGSIFEIPADIDKYIEYYESRFNWDVGMCYVGTNDLTGAYGKPGVEFEYGSGYTIYELYYSMYGTFGSNKISNVGSFINTWLINYGQWFYAIPDERLYLARYNGPDTNITLYYDNLEFPFRNNRVAIYFMTDNLYSRMPEQSMGEHFVFYCDMKLNHNNYKNGSLNFDELLDNVDPKIKDRIKDYNNNFLSSQYGFSVPDMSGASNIWGNLIQTGSGIPEDLNPSGLFKQFYDRINSLLQNFNPKVNFGFIPLWILYPMLFLILFRIFRH